MFKRFRGLMAITIMAASAMISNSANAFVLNGSLYATGNEAEKAFADHVLTSTGANWSGVGGTIDNGCFDILCLGLDHLARRQVARCHRIRIDLRGDRHVRCLSERSIEISR